MTERDYVDMVNPYVRAEEEAHGRGYRAGIGAGIFGTILVLALVAAMILYAVEARSAPKPQWTYEEAEYVIRAGAREAKLSVCQNNGFERKWGCWYRK